MALNLLDHTRLGFGKRPRHTGPGGLTMATAAKDLGHRWHIDIMLGT
jgi:hypothetical protein